MKIVAKTWRNSASARIPAAVMAAAQLSLDQAVEVGEEGGRVIIEPTREKTRAPAFDLDELVAAITEDNRHDAVNTGAPIGREVW